MNLIFKLTQILSLLIFVVFFSFFSTTKVYSQEVLESKQFKLFLLQDTEKNQISPTPKPIRYSLSKQEYDEFQKNGIITRPLGEQKKLQVQLDGLSTQLNQDNTYKDIMVRSINEVIARTQIQKGNPIQVGRRYEHSNSEPKDDYFPSNSFYLTFLSKVIKRTENLSEDTLYVFIQNPNE